MKRTLAFLVSLLVALSGLRAQINTDHMMLVGRNALYYKDYVLSIQYFNQVINAKPYLYDPYFFRGLAKFYLDDFGGAESDCSQAIDRNPFVVDSYQVRALCRMRMGRFDEAITDYRTALSFDPESEGLWHNMALCYGHTERFDEAIGVLDTLHRLAPSYTPALNMRAQIHVQKNDTVAALADIAESISIDRYDPAVYSMRAIVYMQQERYEEAEEDLSYAIRLMPSSNDYVNRALARYYQQNLRGAMADYDLAINLDPNSFLGHYNRGLLRAQVGDNNRAIEDFDFVIDREPDNTIAVFNRALLRAQTGDYAGAEEDFTAVITDYPSFIYGYECRAEVREKLGKKKRAEEDHLVVLKSQLSAWDNGQNSQASNKNEDAEDTEGEDNGVRRKSDRNVRKYNRLVIADEDLALEGGEYNTDYRGSVQNRNFHIEILPLYVVTCYERENGLTRTLHYHHDLDAVNRSGQVPRRLLITAAEAALDEEQIAFHFADIDAQTAGLADSADDNDPLAQRAVAIHWFMRGLDFYLVQDLVSAIADYSGAIAADGSLWPAYFNRAVARYKQAQIDMATADENDDSAPEYNVQLGSCIADLGKVIDLAPDFADARYNRANIYVQLHDYQAAIADYNEVISMNPAFAEAWYNRGLTRLFLGQNEQGVTDLSKAGELGLYSAYSLIKRFSD